MEDNFTSALTGVSKGRFSKLQFLRGGSFHDINAVLDGKVGSVGAGSGISVGGSSTEPVVSADPQLTICLLYTSPSPRDRG